MSDNKSILKNLKPIHKRQLIILGKIIYPGNKSFGYKLARDILMLLESNPHKTYTVTELYVKFRVEQAVVSQALKKLRDINVVKYTTNNDHFYYYKYNNNEAIKNILFNTKIININNK